MPEFYMIFVLKIFFSIFGGNCPRCPHCPLPVSYALTVVECMMTEFLCVCFSHLCRCWNLCLWWIHVQGA